jgi:hypothetical protein
MVQIVALPSYQQWRIKKPAGSGLFVARKRSMCQNFVQEILGARLAVFRVLEELFG